MECREIHEKKWFSFKTFFIVNMLDEILLNHTMIQKFWRHYWVIWEQKELKKVTAKNHCSQQLLLCSKVRARQKSLNGATCPTFMTNHAVGFGTCIQGMKIPSYLSSEMHLQNFSDHTKFQSWIMNFRTEVYAKARNKRKGAKLLRRAEDWRMDIVHMETFSIFYTLICTGRRETVEKSEKRQEDVT